MTRMLPRITRAIISMVLLSLSLIDDEPCDATDPPECAAVDVGDIVVSSADMRWYRYVGAKSGGN